LGVEQTFLEDLEIEKAILKVQLFFSWYHEILALFFESLMSLNGNLVILSFRDSIALEGKENLQPS